MNVSEAMTRDVCVCRPGDTIRACAEAMSRNDLGAVPVAQDNLLVGMLTDRDIAVRAVAAGKLPETPVREVLTRELLFCYEDQDLGHVASAMGAAKVRRVPVLTRDNRLAGMLSLADVARRDAGIAADALAGLSRRGGPHLQGQAR